MVMLRQGCYAAASASVPPSQAATPVLRQAQFGRALSGLESGPAFWQWPRGHHRIRRCSLVNLANPANTLHIRASVRALDHDIPAVSFGWFGRFLGFGFWLLLWGFGFQCTIYAVQGSHEPKQKIVDKDTNTPTAQPTVSAVPEQLPEYSCNNLHKSSAALPNKTPEATAPGKPDKATTTTKRRVPAPIFTFS